MKKMIWVGCLGAIVAISACNKDNNNTATTINSTDSSFLMQTSMGNQAEIQLGQLATTQGTKDSIKAFGQSMVMEHSMAQTDLKTLAGNLNVPVSDSLDAAHKLMRQQLMGLSGRTFDSTYIKGQIMDHQNTVTIYQNELTNGSNQQVKDYANKYLPHVQMHLQRATNIASKL